MAQRETAWFGWGESPVGVRHPNPPELRHISGAYTCCVHCSPRLLHRQRCTTGEDTVLNCSDAELRTGSGAAAHACVLDRDDELERRDRQRRYAPTTTTNPKRSGLLERLRGAD